MKYLGTKVRWHEAWLWILLLQVQKGSQGFIDDGRSVLEGGYLLERDTGEGLAQVTTLACQGLNCRSLVEGSKPCLTWPLGLMARISLLLCPSTQEHSDVTVVIQTDRLLRRQTLTATAYSQRMKFALTYTPTSFPSTKPSRASRVDCRFPSTRFGLPTSRRQISSLSRMKVLQTMTKSQAV